VAALVAEVADDQPERLTPQPASATGGADGDVEPDVLVVRLGLDVHLEPAHHRSAALDHPAVAAG